MSYHAPKLSFAMLALSLIMLICYVYGNNHGQLVSLCIARIQVIDLDPAPRTQMPYIISAPKFPDFVSFGLFSACANQTMYGFSNVYCSQASFGYDLSSNATILNAVQNVLSPSDLYRVSLPLQVTIMVCIAIDSLYFLVKLYIIVSHCYQPSKDNHDCEATDCVHTPQPGCTEHVLLAVAVIIGIVLSTLVCVFHIRFSNYIERSANDIITSISGTTNFKTVKITTSSGNAILVPIFAILLMCFGGALVHA